MTQEKQTREEFIQEATRQAYVEVGNEVLVFITELTQDFEDGYRYVDFSSDIKKFITREILADPKSTIDRDIMLSALNDLKESFEELLSE